MQQNFQPCRILSCFRISELRLTGTGLYNNSIILLYFLRAVQLPEVTQQTMLSPSQRTARLSTDKALAMTEWIRHRAGWLRMSWWSAAAGDGESAAENWV